MPNCRDCEIRVQCIQESDRAPGIKEMILRTFAAGRDTQQLWDDLQRECLLHRPKQHRESLLSKRLRGKAQADDAAKEQPGDADREGEIEKAAPHPSPVTPAAVHKPAREPVRAHSKKVREKREKRVCSCYCLTPQNGHHQIALPAHGEIILGRFDLKADVTPDVDLSRYEKKGRLISRRHARIVGRHDRHYIEDLGSANGTQVNGHMLTIGQKIPLQSGDQIILGGVEFIYAPVSKMQISLPAAPSRAYLWVAFTGKRFLLPGWGEVIVGRSDRRRGIVPDIDLSAEGDAAQVVTRRHVKIIARDGRHYVEDLGSTNSTKLNGVRIESQEFVPLNPGDHLWLGGCVLVYDMDYGVKTEYGLKPQFIGEGLG